MKGIKKGVEIEYDYIEAGISETGGRPWIRFSGSTVDEVIKEARKQIPNLKRPLGWEALILNISYIRDGEIVTGDSFRLGLDGSLLNKDEI